MQLKAILLLSATFFVSCLLYAQPEIKGASCVIPGTEYDYFIDAGKDSATTISICIEGGNFTDTKQACKTIKPFSSVRVSWDENAAIAGLSVGGTNLLKINKTALLDAGEIDSAAKRQLLKYDSASATITCSRATGGNCSPVYAYQWQQSDDALTWTDIEGAIKQNLPSQGAMKTPVFYRRKVTETIAGTVAYSTIATVFVEPGITLQ